MSNVKNVAHGSRANAYTALILSTLAMIVCFMSWSNFAPLPFPFVSSVYILV